MSEEEPIGVVGVGWVGLVTAPASPSWATASWPGTSWPRRSRPSRPGEVPFHEPRPAELIEGNSERLSFTTEMEELLDAARLILVCVQTPPTHSGDADLWA